MFEIGRARIDETNNQKRRRRRNGIHATQGAPKRRPMVKLKRALAVIGVVALYLSPGFILLAVALGMKWDVAVFIYLGAVIVIRIVFNIDY
jgi:hypothetical protein